MVSPNYSTPMFCIGRSFWPCVWVTSAERHWYWPVGLKWQGSLSWESVVALSAVVESDIHSEVQRVTMRQAGKSRDGQSNCKSFTLSWLTWKHCQVCREKLGAVWYCEWYSTRVIWKSHMLCVEMWTCAQLCVMHARDVVKQRNLQLVFKILRIILLVNYTMISCYFQCYRHHCSTSRSLNAISNSLPQANAILKSALYF
jgi:hypothetical protein